LLFIGSLKRNILAGYWLFPAYFANWQAGSRSIGEPDHLAGIIALPLSAYWGIGALRTPTKRLNSILGGALKALIILAICWFPISFLLAGNLSFNFAGIPSFQGGPIAMRLFWVLSYGLALGTILIISIYWVLQLLQQVKKGRH
jgi:hypothetical protein